MLASAQRRKMKGYGDFKRIAAVIIPDDDTYKERYDKQTEKTVSENALNEMKGECRIKCFLDFGIVILMIQRRPPSDILIFCSIEILPFQ